MQKPKAAPDAPAPAVETPRTSGKVGAILKKYWGAAAALCLAASGTGYVMRLTTQSEKKEEGPEFKAVVEIAEGIWGKDTLKEALRQHEAYGNKAAIHFLEKKMEQGPLPLETSLFLAHLYEEEGEAARRLALLERLAETSKGVSVYLMLATAHEKTENWQKAIDACEKAKTYARPGGPDDLIGFRIAGYLERMDRRDEARTLRAQTEEIIKASAGPPPPVGP